MTEPILELDDPLRAAVRYAELSPRARAGVAVHVLRRMGVDVGSIKARELTLEEAATITPEEFALYPDTPKRRFWR